MGLCCLGESCGVVIELVCCVLERWALAVMCLLVLLGWLLFPPPFARGASDVSTFVGFR